MTSENTHHPQVTLISAMSSDRIIGSGDGMPWEVPDEYQHFLDTTRGQTIILGRKSFEIFGPTLTSHRCFVVTRSEADFANGIAVSPLDAALTKARLFPEQIFVAGGASIYRLAIDHADEMQLSIIPGDWTGDSTFPEIDESQWQIRSQEDRGSYLFTHYIRAQKCS